MKIRNRIGKGIASIGVKLKSKNGFGMNELLGIAAALILAAFIIIPGLKGFATTVMGKLTSWWSVDVMGKIFPTS